MWRIEQETKEEKRKKMVEKGGKEGKGKKK